MIFFLYCFSLTSWPNVTIKVYEFLSIICIYSLFFKFLILFIKIFYISHIYYFQNFLLLSSLQRIKQYAGEKHSNMGGFWNLPRLARRGIFIFFPGLTALPAQAPLNNGHKVAPTRGNARGDGDEENAKPPRDPSHRGSCTSRRHPRKLQFKPREATRSRELRIGGRVERWVVGSPRARHAHNGVSDDASPRPRDASATRRVSAHRF